MKKQLFFVLALVLFGAKVFGQGTGVAPSIGSIHDYWVNGSATSHDVAHAGSTYTWWISTTPTDLTARTASNTDFTVVTGGAAYDTPTANANMIKLQWNPASAGNTYYLVIKEDGVAPLCTNIKAIAITPTNNFKLKFEAIASNGTTLTDDPTRCPANIALTASGSTITYDYGSDNFMFKVTSTDLYSAWSFANTFVNSIGNSAATLEYQIGGTTGTWTTYTSGATINVPANSAGTEVVYFRVSLDNGSTAGTFEENLTQRTIQSTLSAVKDAGGNGVTTITNNANTNITTSPVQTQTIQARPSTSTIGYN